MRGDAVRPDITRRLRQTRFPEAVSAAMERLVVYRNTWCAVGGDGGGDQMPLALAVAGHGGGT